MTEDCGIVHDDARSVARRDFVRSVVLATAGVAAGTAALAAGAASPAAADQSDKGSGRVRKFIRDVTRARIFDLAPVWDENSPIASVNPPYSMFLNATHASTRGTFGDGGKLSFT